PYLPHNYVTNTVVYTGTHDNNTTRGWFEELPDSQQQHLWRYLKRPAGVVNEAAPALKGLAWASPGAVAVGPVQDLLHPGREARMNVPGRAGGNWRWRCPEVMLTASAFQWLRALTETSNRAGVLPGPPAGR